MRSRVQEEIKRFKELKDKIKYRPEAIEQQHKRGRLTALERIERLLDPGTFEEIDIFVKLRVPYFGLDKRDIPAEGVITGCGKVDGRTVFVFSQDYTALAGTYGEMHGQKICKIMDQALEVGAPVVGICESAGIRLHEILWPMRWFGELFYRNSIYSGVIPQITAVMGTVAGGQAYSPGLTDFIFMVKDSYMYIAGPAFVKTVIGEEATEADLGGALMHASTSGVCHYLAETEEDCLEKIRELLSYLPSSCREEPPFVETGDVASRSTPELENIVPDDPKEVYDMREVIKAIVDNGKFFEIHALYAPSIIVGFARLGGHSVGIVANQPSVNFGVIDVWAAEKAARFIRFCDAFNIPLVYIVDSPGFAIGPEQERLGLAFRGATMIYATSEATVPKISVILRKAFGGALIAMGSRYLGADRAYAWPIAEISVMYPERAAKRLFAEELKKSPNPQEELKRLLQEYHEKFVSPLHAAQLQHIDDIIEPAETRIRLIKALETFRKRKKEATPTSLYGVWGPRVYRKKHDCMPF